MKQEAFGSKGRFYKGNLHAHTDISDGKKPVDEVVEIYRSKGYDFLAITDHNTVFQSDEYNKGIYLIPALEIHSSKPDTFRTHHMLALTTYNNPKTYHGERIENVEWTESIESAENIYKMMRDKDFELIYCHSVWSRTEPWEYENLDFIAMEVYNGVCEYSCNQGNQEIYWDTLLRKGKRIWGVATDDSHGVDNHYDRGFVMVKADELNDVSIIEALKCGNFYSSRGPEIIDFYLEDGKAHIKCSPAGRITFITYEYLGRSFIHEKPVTELSYEYNPNADYIRVEIEDENGLKAWTNPIFIKK